MTLLTIILVVHSIWSLTAGNIWAYAYSVDYGSVSCLSFAIGENSSKIHDDYWDDKGEMALRLSSKFLQQEAKTLNLFLTSHAKCLRVIVSDVDNLLVAINLTKSVEEHIIIYSGQIQPPIGFLSDVQRPMMVLLEVTNTLHNGTILPNGIMQHKCFSCYFVILQGTNRINLHCPKETSQGHNFVIKTFPLSFFRNMVAGVTELCPNPLRGQKLIVSSSGGAIYRGGELVGGYQVRLFWYLGEKFRFQAVFKKETGGYNAKKKMFVGRVQKVNTGEYLMAAGGIVRPLFSHFNFLPAHSTYHFAFASRTARPLDRYDNILLPFSLTVWVAIVITAIAFAVVFSITHGTYETRSLEWAGFHKREKNKSNFLLYTVSKLTEPDPLPWFTKKWSAGKMLAMLWAVFGLFLVMFYNSNFRAHLTARSFEKSLDTIQDVADNNGVSWFHGNVRAMHASGLEAAGRTEIPLYKIAKQVESSGTYFEAHKEGGVPVHAIQDVLKKRGTVTITRIGLPETHQRLKDLLGGEMLYLTRENAHYYHNCFILRKNHMMRRPIHNAIRVAIDMGLPNKWEHEFLPMELVLPQTSAERDNHPSTLEPMTLDQMIASISFYLCSMVLSLCAFAWESKISIVVVLKKLSIYIYKYATKVKDATNELWKKL